MKLIQRLARSPDKALMRDPVNSTKIYKCTLHFNGLSTNLQLQRNLFPNENYYTTQVVMTLLTPNNLSTCCDETQFTDIHLQNKKSYKIKPARGVSIKERQKEKATYRKSDKLKTASKEWQEYCWFEAKFVFLMTKLTLILSMKFI